METQATKIEINAEQVWDALLQFINQRSGIDWRDYYSTWSDTDGRRAFQSEYREILKEGRDARNLLHLARCTVSTEILTEKIERDQGSRLSYNHEKQRFEYVTGQYFPTEYRAAACRLLASLLTTALTPDGDNWKEKRVKLLKRLKDLLGRGIVKRWFE